MEDSRLIICTSEDESTQPDSGNSILEYPLSCTKCSQKFSTGTELINHLNTHSSHAYPYSCTICNKVFSRRQILKNHYLSHIERVYYTCPVCAKIYKSGKPFKDHIACHTGCTVKDIAQYCNLPFQDELAEFSPGKDSDNAENSIDKDMCSVSRPIESPDYQSFNTHKCAKCGQRFKRKKELCSHLQNSNCMGPYSCSVCGKIFHQKQLLRNHYLTHQDEKIRICPVCDKAYKSMKPFTDHLASHDLSLADLKRRANDSEMLNESSNTQEEFIDTVIPCQNSDSLPPEEIDPLCDSECPFCSLVFNRRSRLEHHIQSTHANSDQYQCFLCHKILLNANDIMHHLVTHARSNLHVCPLCEKLFENFATFKIHFDTVHSHLHHSKSSFTEFNKSETSAEELRPSAFVQFSNQATYSSSIMSYTCSFCLKVFHDKSLHLQHQQSECLMNNQSRQSDHHVLSDSLSYNPISNAFVGSSSSSKQVYHCLQCPRSFAIQSDLRIHEESHSNETSFKCSCGKTCNTMSAFVYHLEKRECSVESGRNSEPYGHNSLITSFHSSSFNNLHRALDFSMK